MLRALFGEEPAAPAGHVAEALKAMQAYASALHLYVASGRDQDHKARTREVMTFGLMASLDELEQSCYAASRYGALVTSDSWADMPPEERLQYRRYVYFDKNAFIRLFSLLDKLGTLLNDALALNTQQFKVRFSYFTVLRRMREKKLHPALAGPLSDLKAKHDKPVARLRKRRNEEIHNLNSELQDDLLQMHLHFGEEIGLESISDQLEDMASGLELAAASLQLAFAYLASLAEEKAPQPGR
ncbi:hypothetical protein HGI30_18085 [Paenibacillus albicereus]|uniref:Cthe-2314-like HEPN domain-containing protein n=1 Tax=Paenibacillus albicereus TaxID=2726185 RepID=A0A6H2H1K1_9BACL|nr:Cthe_2314 family HEPN domain-containing protein [Paenibacillus albicereus]QJC53296.1 hypothetical protein HGI30_18085 [Paenibacillus albicereus]